MESIDRSLGAIFGESGKRVILYHIKRQCGFEADEIVQKSREFADALEKIFGIGAQIIEVNILRNVYRDFGLDYKEDKEFDFAQRLREAVDHIKNRNRGVKWASIR